MRARPSADAHRPHGAHISRVAAALYLLLAGALAGAVLCADPPATHLSPPQLLLPCALILAAVVVERASRRAVSLPPAIGSASSVYAAAGLLLPAPWAVIVAAGGATLCHLPRRRLDLTTRLVSIAQPLATMVVFVVLVGRVMDIAGGQPGPRGPLAVRDAVTPYSDAIAMPGRPPVATLLASPIPALTALGILAALAIAYAAMDMGSTALAARVRRGGGVCPAGVGGEVWRPQFFAAGAAPCLGVMVAALFAVAPPLAILGALPALALPPTGRARRPGPGQARRERGHARPPSRRRAGGSKRSPPTASSPRPFPCPRRPPIPPPTPVAAPALRLPRKGATAWRRRSRPCGRSAATRTSRG